ncbi:hypothetical protein EDD21DRAFT_210339 [Dissophora ornata]|nr:hypothetical protein BGZ58_002219 [Dissophora ornata]KAI8604541.1 hypothetical protein EDD21DRAFT_210339 [Dissophora ornata]
MALFSVFAKAGSLRSHSHWSSSSSSSPSSPSSSSFSPSSPSPSPSRRHPRTQSAHCLSFIVVLIFSIALSSLYIPLAESASLSAQLPDSSSAPSLSQLLRLPSEVKVLIQVPEEEPLNSALVDSTIESAIDLPEIAATPEELSGAHFYKRATTTVVPATTTTTSEASKTTTKTKSPSTVTSSSGGATKTTMSSTTTTVVSASPAATRAPDSKGDTALFGKPSVIGGYNLTAGILVYSSFMLVFVVAIGAATWRRAQYRNRFRLQQQRNMEGGRVGAGDKGSKKGGGDAELSDAALFKQASISKRALMKDVGHGGSLAANDFTETKIAAANGAGRSFDERGMGQQQSGQGVRFGEGSRNNQPSGGPGRAGGMKKTNRGDVNQGAFEMNSYQQDDPISPQDNHDTSDYSRPPLAENADMYYSSGSSHSGYLDQVDDFNGPQKPKAAYQQEQPAAVKRSNSTRMPKTELHDGNNIFRSNSGRRAGATSPTGGVERSGSGGNRNGGQPARIATQGLNRSGSGGRSAGTSPEEGGMSRAGSNASSSRTRVSPSPIQAHPTPIARSNSTRLPPSMRGGNTQPSGLSQQTNNYEYV